MVKRLLVLVSILFMIMLVPASSAAEEPSMQLQGGNLYVHQGPHPWDSNPPRIDYFKEWSIGPFSIGVLKRYYYIRCYNCGYKNILSSEDYRYYYRYKQFMCRRCFTFNFMD